jgi:hypothetical protein
MKLIQIFALTAALAGMAAGQNSPTSPQPAATPAKSPAATGSSAPATKANPAKKAGTKSTSAPAKTSPATKSSPAANKAATKKTGAQSAPAKTAGATTAPATKSAGAPASKTGSAPASKTGTAPASKSGTAPASKPPATVAVGTLPPQKGTKAGKSAASAAKGAKKRVGTTVAKKTPGSKPATAGKSTKPSVARVEPAPRAEPKPATPAKLLGAAGRRDPFVSPIRSASSVSPTAACTSGKRCLAIPELILQGTVRDVSGKMMAVVTTSNRRTYTLRENDQVFNGSVEKITSDSIIFREYVRDPLGRESAREVVKKLGPTT